MRFYLLSSLETEQPGNILVSSLFSDSRFSSLVRIKNVFRFIPLYSSPNTIDLRDLAFTACSSERVILTDNSFDSTLSCAKLRLHSKEKSRIVKKLFIIMGRLIDSIFLIAECGEMIISVNCSSIEIRTITLKTS